MATYGLLLATLVDYNVPTLAIRHMVAAHTMST